MTTSTNSKEYFEERAKIAERYVGFLVKPETLEYVVSVFDLKKSRQACIEYVTNKKIVWRKDGREQSLEFLKETNHFLSSIKDAELNIVLENPKDKRSVEDMLRVVISYINPDLKEEGLILTHIHTIKKIFTDKVKLRADTLFR